MNGQRNKQFITVDEDAIYVLNNLRFKDDSNTVKICKPHASIDELVDMCDGWYGRDEVLTAYYRMQVFLSYDLYYEIEKIYTYSNKERYNELLLVNNTEIKSQPYSYEFDTGMHDNLKATDELVVIEIPKEFVVLVPAAAHSAIDNAMWYSRVENETLVREQTLRGIIWDVLLNTLPITIK